MKLLSRRGGRRVLALVPLAALLLGCAREGQRVEVSPVAFRVTHRKADTSRKARQPDVELAVSMPRLPRNASCRQARAAYIERWELEAGDVPPDLSRGQLSSVLVSGRYVQACRVPDSYEVRICAAVHEGRVLGATVETSPRAPQLARCVDKQVRGLAFPHSRRMDVTNTVFYASR